MSHQLDLCKKAPEKHSALPSLVRTKPTVSSPVKMHDILCSDDRGVFAEQKIWVGTVKTTWRGSEESKRSKCFPCPNSIQDTQLQ